MLQPTLVLVAMLMGSWITGIYSSVTLMRLIQVKIFIAHYYARNPLLIHISTYVGYNPGLTNSVYKRISAFTHKRVSYSDPS